MADIFCCSSIKPDRPHRFEIDLFMHFARLSSPVPSDDSLLIRRVNYAVQLVNKVSFEPLQSIRYFIPAGDGFKFVEVTESELSKANFEKLISYRTIYCISYGLQPVLTNIINVCRYKNFQCGKHNRFFEVNLYQQYPTNWRANLSRPSTDIDLVYRQKKDAAKPSAEAEAMKQEGQSADPNHGASGSESPGLSLQAHEASCKTLDSNRWEQLLICMLDVCAARSLELEVGPSTFTSKSQDKPWRKPPCISSFS